MSPTRSPSGPRVRVGVALSLLCCTGILSCRDGSPTSPAYVPVTIVPEQPAPPAPAPITPWFVVDTGPIPAGRLAFELEVFPLSGSSPYYPRIYTMRTDGTGLLALTPADEAGRAPAWSPDGSRLAYESYHDGAPDIWIVRPDGTSRALVASAATEPFWLDATHLGYRCGASLCAVRDDGTQPRVLLAREPDRDVQDFSYSLSPDGRTFAFTRLAYTGTYPVSTYVYLMNVDGSGERAMTQATEGSLPHWSPVGRSIAFSSARYGTAVVDVDGGVLTSVSQRNGFSLLRGVGNPGWSPTGAELVFGNDVHAFYFARADGTGPIRRVGAPISLDPGRTSVVNAWAWTSP